MIINKIKYEQAIYLFSLVKHEALAGKPILMKVFNAMVMSANEEGYFSPNETFKKDLSDKLETSYSVIANAISRLKEMNIIAAVGPRGQYFIPEHQDFHVPDKNAVYDLKIELTASNKVKTTLIKENGDSDLFR